MSQSLTQPEEIDQILKKWDRSDAGTPPAKNNRQNGIDRKGWCVGAGYISPYRAAYMKSHNFSAKYGPV